jgi:peroxiredoxin
VRAFGVAQTLDGLVDSPVRSAFLIDASGTIRRAWRSGDDDVPPIDEQLAAARELAAS